MLNNVMDVFKLLEKSNCKKCEMPTCLAFAAAVFQGRKPLSDCPHLDAETPARYGRQSAPQPSAGEQDAQKELVVCLSYLTRAGNFCIIRQGLQNTCFMDLCHQPKNHVVK